MAPQRAASLPGDHEARRFLFVTMPSGPFSRRLAVALKARGAETARILFHGGEAFDWGARGGFRFPGPLDAFGAWIDGIMDAWAATDVIVFNDANPYSHEALLAARARGCATWILENGYQRPDWITLETIGVNAQSGLPRDPAAYADAHRLPAPIDGPHIGSITPHHVFNTVQHFTVMVACSPFMRGYRYPYAISIAAQVWGHTRRFLEFLIQRKARARQAEQVSRLRPFFLVCLQREGDSQLMVHSDLRTNRAFLETVIASFAAHAEPAARLVVKNHPLDPGIQDLEQLTASLAREHGVAHRVSFLEGGVFATLARASEGVVAVNSTAALAAMGFGVPVKLLGRAFFDIPGLSDQQPLETFWTAPAMPDSDLFARFRRRMSVETQIYGSYHNPKAMSGTAERVAERMLGARASS